MRAEARRLNEEMRNVRAQKTPEEKIVDRMMADNRERIKRKNRDRDVSAQVALAVPLTTQAVDDEFDSQPDAKGGGTGPGYAVYDAPMFVEKKAYAPFADGRGGERGRYAGAVAAGQVSAVKFTAGEKRAAGQRAGVFDPGR
jgi:hypothetical protein